MSIIDEYLEKNGNRINKAYLMDIDNDNILCDGCDEMKPCAVIHPMTPNSDVLVLCKDCISEILNAF